MHIPVLLQEVVDGLSPKRGEAILDATVGDGGHSEALCNAMGGVGTIVCFDEDEDALARSKEKLSPPAGGCGCRFLFYRTNFRNLDAALQALGVAKIDKAIFDLGLSSSELSPPGGGSGRGFSFERDEPLLMTFGKRKEGLTAREIVNRWDEKNIAAVIRGFGEERQANRIARAIVAARMRKPIETSGALAEIIARVLRRRGRIHPATKTFQALRIAVNDELGALAEALPKCFRSLAAGGRMAVISYHSGEDRIVKSFFRAKAKDGAGLLLTKKPVVPTCQSHRAFEHQNGSQTTLQVASGEVLNKMQHPIRQPHPFVMLIT
jgi:16S rRNA (cytosine1402-N4)-methyltransferase